MEKHKKLEASINYINHKELKKIKIIHLKTTPTKNGITHFYWNNKRSELIIGAKVQFPVPSIAHIEHYEESFFDNNRNEIQLGDSIIWFFGKSIQPLVCATVIGACKIKRKRYLRLQPNHSQSIVPETWAEFDINKFFFVSNNKVERYRAPPNLIYAAFQDELDKVEEIYAPIRSRRIIINYLTNRNLMMGEKTFRECHLTLFKGIYAWAGDYRKIEIVVTDRQFPTLHPDEIEIKMKEFCQNFSNQYLRWVGNERVKMLQALVFAHTELAWIHPFQDGNGRAIRLYLELIAKTRGFEFDLNASLQSQTKKRYYHFAVRKAVQGYNKILTTLLNKILV